MPVVDGWEATRRLKGNPQTRDIPVIVLSAHALAGEREEAIAAGCDEFDTTRVFGRGNDRKLRAIKNIGSHRTAWWWMQPASNRSPPQIPANRENNREFRGNSRSAAILAPNQRANPRVCNQIPYATEQGIFKPVSGKSFQGTGNLPREMLGVLNI